MPETLVEMKNITKTFPGVKALDDAQLTLYKGEVLGLLGENGAGKSTLMNVLGGVYIPDSGSISIDGKEAKITNVVDAQNLGVAFIHQEIALVPYLSVAENIFLGRERMSAGMVDKRKMYEEAKQWLDMVGLDVNPATMLCKLSIGRQQMVEIAKACSLNMKLLIMDEPTSSLSESEVDSLFEMIRKLKNRGIGIIYISHKLEEVFTITDRVCVMRDGGYVGTIITKESDRDTLVSMMVGRALDNYYTRTFNEPGEVVFEVKNINSGIRVKNCSFKVRKGEIVGFYAALTMQILNLLTGDPAIFMDVRHWDQENEVMEFCNCGSQSTWYAAASDDFKENLAKVTLYPALDLYPGGGCHVNLQTKPGKATIARLCRRKRGSEERYYMTIIPCEFVELPKEREKLTTMEWPHVFAKLPFDHNIFLDRFGANHCHAVYGDHVDELKMICKMLDVDVEMYNE